MPDRPNDNNSGISEVVYRPEALFGSDWDLRSIEPWVRILGRATAPEVTRILGVLHEVWPSEPPETLEDLTAAIKRFDAALRHEFRHSSELEAVVALQKTLTQIILADARRKGRLTADVPVSIYVDDESAGPDVEQAVVELLDQLGLPVVQADPPILSSWFRRMRAKSRLMMDSPEFAELMAKTTRALELRALDQVQAQVDAGQGDAAAKIITALGASKIRNAVVQVGSILAVKVEDEITVRTLTQLEMAVLTRQPDLLRNPRGILLALRMEVEQTAASLPGAQTARSGQ